MRREEVARSPTIALALVRDADDATRKPYVKWVRVSLVCTLCQL